MAILLHGLVPAGTACADAPDHTLIDCGPFAALVSPAPPVLADLLPEAIAELALHHNAVLVAYCGTSAVLPMRFGAAFSSATAARDQLLTEAEANQRALAAVAGLTEYTLRLNVTSDPPLPDHKPTSGREFLSRGRDLRDRRKMLVDDRIQLARDLRAELNRICHQIEAATAPKPDRLVDLALLILSSEQPALTRIVNDFAPLVAPLGLALRLTGPWPAYSFRMPVAEVPHGT